MSRFHKMVSMERTPEDKEEIAEEAMPGPANVPDVPYGLCLCLTEQELEKLDLDDECEVGDMIHLFAMARVTSISKNDTGTGTKCRIELAVTDLAVEDEDDEEEPD